MKIKPVIAKDNLEMAEMMGLTQADALEVEFRSKLNTKIIDIVEKEKLTHAKIAEASGCSRTRITALLNRNRQGMTTDFMLRVLYSLGYAIKPSFKKVKKQYAI